MGRSTYSAEPPGGLQPSRHGGWRAPADAVVVSRPSLFRNPFRIVPPAQGAAGWRVDGVDDVDGFQVWRFATEPAARAFAVAAFTARLHDHRAAPRRRIVCFRGTDR